MPARYQTPSEQESNSAGVPYAGGTLYFYVTGTSTPTNTYSDSALAVPNTNPVVLDSAGRCGNIFLDPAVTYKVILKDSLANVIWTADPVTAGQSIAATFAVYAGNPNGNVAGNAGSVGGQGASVVYDITDKLVYVCTTTGVAAAAVWTSPSLSLTGKEGIHGSNYTVVAADNGYTQVANSGSGITFTLTAAATLGAGFILPYKNIGAGILTISTSDNVDGASTLAVPQYVGGVLYCNGSTWRGLASYSLLDTDGTLAANSDSRVPSQKAVKTFATQTALVPIGGIIPYGGASAPSLWLLAFGQNVSRTTYSALFTAYSTTYGAGDGSTTFGLPDLRGRAVAGKDNMGGSAASRLTNASTNGVDGSASGNTGGEQSHTPTLAELFAHTHAIASGGSLVSNIPNNYFGNGGALVGGTTSLSNAGSSTPHNNVQPTFILNYIIYAGV